MDPNPLFVPGRLCLFGEHSDWAGTFRRTHPALAAGRCLVAGTDQGLAAEAAILADAVEFRTVLPDGSRKGPVRLPLDREGLEAAAQAGGFFSYVAGVAAEVRARFAVGGLRLDIVRNDLPLAKGLSSSAAVSVLLARAFSEAYGLGLDVREEMDVAYAGERRAGSTCGRMDQVCAFGQRTTEIVFDADAFEVTPLAVGGTIPLLIVDLGRDKDTRRILRDLQRLFPDDPSAMAVAVRDALGPRNQAITANAKLALAAGDARGLGERMTEAQRVFDEQVAPASPALASPRLHEVLAHPLVTELAWGGKGVGSQGDGCAQIVARGEAERARLAEGLAEAFGVRCLPLTLRSAQG